ncbi:hypothetical protein N9L68_03230 [bacterium]|nr:hypothetical protein [bacterium]
MSRTTVQAGEENIRGHIVRLLEEANDEATRKGWSDTELSTNEQTRKEQRKNAAMETLHADIDQLTAPVAKKLTENVAELTQTVADLDAAMAKATNLRAAEKAKNVDTIKDAQQAQEGVAQALVVLKEFYAKAAETAALV